MAVDFNAIINKGVDKVAKKFSNKVGANQMNDYINKRIVENSFKLGDSFSNSKKAKYLQKVAQKASSDWLSMNKFKALLMKNSNKIAKVGVVGSLALIAASIGSSMAKATTSKKHIY